MPPPAGDVLPAMVELACGLKAAKARAPPPDTSAEFPEIRVSRTVTPWRVWPPVQIPPPLSVAWLSSNRQWRTFADWLLIPRSWRTTYKPPPLDASFAANVQRE